jgi:hypothetical protein
MFGLSGWEIAWGCTCFVVATVTFISQVGPEQAASNLSQWVQWVGLKAPSWLKKRAADRWVFRVGFVMLLGLSFLAGIRVEPWLYPPAPPQIVQVPAPAAQINIPAKLVENISPPIPPDVALRGARYLLLKRLIADVTQMKKALDSSGPRALENIKPAPPGMVRRSMAMMEWNQALRVLESLNGEAYKNRLIDLKSAPELSINTITAPGEDAFTATDEHTQQEKYNFRSFYFLMRNVDKQADALITDMQREQDGVVRALETDAAGKEFLQESK